jgi:hypothetical protein
MAGELLRAVSTIGASRRKERAMTKVFGIVLALAALLFAAPVIESGTSGSTQWFQAIGTADGGGGGP